MCKSFGSSHSIAGGSSQRKARQFSEPEVWHNQAEKREREKEFSAAPKLYLHRSIIRLESDLNRIQSNEPRSFHNHWGESGLQAFPKCEEHSLMRRFGNDSTTKLVPGPLSTDQRQLTNLHLGKHLTRDMSCGMSFLSVSNPAINSIQFNNKAC